MIEGCKGEGTEKVRQTRELTKAKTKARKNERNKIYDSRYFGFGD